MPLPPPVLQATALRFSRADGFSLALETLSLRPGERLAVTGPSGCGKSTLLHLLAGILVPESGTVRIAGQDLSTLSEAARRQLRLSRIGLVFQDFRLLPHLTGLGNLLLPFRLGHPQALDQALLSQAETLAERLGLQHCLARRPAALSQGERQRLALARALLPGPQVILADEPTASLDSRTRHQALALLEAEADRLQAALLVVTHELDLVAGWPQLILADPVRP